jgi:hypothetical protein
MIWSQFRENFSITPIETEVLKKSCRGYNVGLVVRGRGDKECSDK